MIDRRLLLSLIAVLALNELASYFVSLNDLAGTVAFVAITLCFTAVALLSTDAALLIVVAELVVGGKGYLYHLPLGGFDLSIRLALFVILLLIWFMKRRYKKRSFFTSVSPYSAYLVALAILVTVGIMTALLRGRDLLTIFFDANAYLYFLLAPVIFTSLERREQRKRLYNLFFAGVSIIGLKSLIMLGLFTHDTVSGLLPIYRWIRDSGVGEVAHIFGRFYRVFFQSQIFGLAGFLIAFGILTMRFVRRAHDDRGGLAVIAIAGIVAMLISLSRSFWVGSVVALLALALWLLRTRTPQLALGQTVGSLVGLCAVAGLLISWALYFPYPFPINQGARGGDALVRERFSRNQPAVSSRTALLAPLLKHVGDHPVLGTGFATPITYRSSDPRVARSGRPATYTTTAFEWGWLDIAVKLGLTGVLVYLMLLRRLVLDCLERLTDPNPEHAAVSLGLLLALIGLAATHIFSPYLNHPLGIGIVLLSAALLRSFPSRRLWTPA